MEVYSCNGKCMTQNMYVCISQIRELYVRTWCILNASYCQKQLESYVIKENISPQLHSTFFSFLINR